MPTDHDTMMLLVLIGLVLGQECISTPCLDQARANRLLRLTFLMQTIQPTLRSVSFKVPITAF